jgi:deoxycytidine triphosphate deaminase
MLLPDHEIRALCTEHALIHPFNPERLNPASYDVALGSNIMIEVAETPELIRHNISWLHQGRAVLAEPR